MTKKLLSILLIVAMAFTLVVVPVSATGEPTMEITSSEGTSFVESANARAITVSVLLHNPNPTQNDIAGISFQLVSESEYVELATEATSLTEAFGVGYTTYNAPAFTALKMEGLATRPITDTEVTLITIGATLKANAPIGDYVIKTAKMSVSNTSSAAVYSDNPTITIHVTKAPLASATATVDAPVKGSALDDTVTCGAATYTGAVAWYEGETVTGDAVSGTAKANQIYTAQITLTPASGESFADPTSVTVNGGTAQNVSPDGGGRLVVTKTFSATGDKNALKGSVTVSNTNPKYGDSLSIDITGLNYDGETPGEITYLWLKEDGGVVGTGNPYTVTNSAIGNKIKVRISTAGNSGYVESALTAVVAKADCATEAVAAMVSKTATSATVTNVTDGQEYAITTGNAEPADGWNTTGSFTGLNANTSYTVYTRVAETATHSKSAAQTTAVTTDKLSQTISGPAEVSVTFGGTLDLNTKFSTNASGNTLSYVSGGSAPEGTSLSGSTVTAGTTAGQFTVTVSAGAYGAYNAAQDKTVTVKIVSKPSQVFAAGFDTAVTKSFGDSLTKAATLTTGNGAISYTSSNTDVAAVSNTGVVTIKKIGTITITATAAETDTYAETTVSYTLTVNPKAVTPTVTVASGSTYTGSAVTPAVTVKTGGTTLVEGTDYTLSWSNNINAGTAAKVIVTAKDGSNYTWTAPVEKTFTIGPKTITPTITVASGSVYDGTAKTPSVTVAVDTVVLTADTDYTVAYSNNIRAGSAAKVTVTAKPGRNYTWTAAEQTFTIDKKSVSIPADDSTTFTYTGSEQTYAVAAGDDYTVSGNKKTNAGTYTVTITLKDTANTKWSDDTTAAKEKTFTIGKATPVITLETDKGVLFGDAKTLTIKASSTSKEKALTYTSADTGVATVNASGLVTAVANGAVGIAAAQAESDNYVAAVTKTFNVTAIPEPITTVSVSGADADTVTAVLEGRTIKVTGLGSSYTLAYTAASGVTLDTSDETKVVAKLTADETVTQEYAIDADGVAAMPTEVVVAEKPAAGEASTEISEEDQTVVNAAVTDSANASSGLAAAAADTITAAAEKIETPEDIKDGTKPEVDVFVKIEAKRYDGAAGSYVVDIAPFYKVTYTNADDQAQTLVEETQITALAAPVEITLVLPAGFSTANLMVRHTMHSGNVEYIKPTVAFGKITFPVRSFSEFEVLSDSRSAVLTFTFNDGTVQTITYTAEDVGVTSLPTDTKGGYTFKGWRIGGAGTAYKGILTDGMLTALNGTNSMIPGFTANGGGTPTTTTPTTTTTEPAEKTDPCDSFTDVDQDAWYHEAVDYALETGLMSGNGDGTFAPLANLSRAMLCQILYNKEGRPAVTAENPFSDVPADAWYANAVIWAYENKIVYGYGDGLFGPNDNITREQLAAILWRYAGKKTVETSLDAFTDVGKISGYAVDAIKWAYANGVMSGKGNGILDPLGNATRAEVAQMLMNYLKK